MFKFKLNKYKDSCGFLWDNDDNTSPSSPINLYPIGELEELLNPPFFSIILLAIVINIFLQCIYYFQNMI